MKKILSLLIILISCTCTAQQTNGILMKEWFVSGSLSVGQSNRNYADISVWMQIGKDTTDKGIILPRVIEPPANPNNKKGIFFYSIPDEALCQLDGAEVKKYAHQAYVNNIIDSVSSLLVRYLDTASMLMGYLRKLDTLSLSTRIDGKVPNTRTITPILPLTGGGDLSGNINIAIGGLSALGTSNQVLGMNNAGTAYEYKTWSIGSSGSAPSISHTANNITLNIPLMISSGVTSGLLSNTTQTIPGNKTMTGTFTTNTTTLLSNNNFSTSTPTVQVGTNEYGLSSSGGNLYLHAASAIIVKSSIKLRSDGGFVSIGNGIISNHDGYYNFGGNNVSSSNAQVHITHNDRSATGEPAKPTFIIQNSSSQTGDAQQWRNSSGGVMSFVDLNGKIRLGGTASTSAWLNLPAGTAAAGTAPIDIPPGVLLTVPSSGKLESDGTHIYWTDASGTRKQLD